MNRLDGRPRSDADEIGLGPGEWKPGPRGVRVWVPELSQQEIRLNTALLIACPTCHAKVNETCRTRGARADGARPRRTPHMMRLAPRLCRCGSVLKRHRKMCDRCRDEENRANKRDYMRRVRSRSAA